jgi:hypothetical protein
MEKVWSLVRKKDNFGDKSSRLLLLVMKVMRYDERVELLG